MNIPWRMLLLSMLTGVHDVAGQTQPPDTVAASVDLGEVVVSASRVPEARSTVAQQVIVITPREIRRIPASTSADVLEATGAVSVQKSQAGGGSPVLRGFEANRVLLVVDGVRMNNLIYRGGHLQNIITVDHAVLDRVEVLFGPAGTVYGSDALGGVIHLMTRDPVLSADTPRMSVRAQTRYASANRERSAHVDAGWSSRRLGTLTSLTVSRFGNLRGGANRNPFYDGRYGDRPLYVKRIDGIDSLVTNPDPADQVPSGYRQIDLMQKVDFRPDPGRRHRLNVQFSTTGDIPRYDRLTNPSGDGLAYAEWHYGPQQRLMAAYDLVVEPATRGSRFHSLISFQDVHESRHTRRYRSDDLTQRTEHVRVFGLLAEGQRTFRRHTFRTGLDLRYDGLTSTARSEDIATGVSSPLDTRYPDGDNNMVNVAAFAMHRWQASPSLVLNEGFRLGYGGLTSTFSDTAFYPFPFRRARQRHAVYSGSAGLVHRVAESLRWSLLLSTGFRVPNVDDLAKVFDSAPGTVIVPNDELGPEYTFTAEVGAEAGTGSRVHGTFTAYRTWLLNAIVTSPFPLGGADSILYDGVPSLVLANRNERKACIHGFSATLRIPAGPNLRMEFGVHYTHGRVETDSGRIPLDHIPPLLARAAVDVTVARLDVRLTAGYNGWKRLAEYGPGGEDNAAYATPEGMPAWILFGIQAGYPLGRRLHVRAGVDNILDTQYRVFASGINGPGRNFYIALSYPE